MIDLSGANLGQYELIEPIGRGGMATVYRAIQRSMGRVVAIKVIAPDLAEEAEFLSRFEREARIVAGLQHPHILEVHDFGREGKFTYLVMRLMSGGNLKDELRAGIMLPDRVLQIVQQIASALDYAHARGIVHRDLKPSNVLLDEERNVALTDFGIAKMVGGHTLSGDLTLAGEVMGTPKYMAPEQWRSEQVDGRADVYALGILTYQMLTGQVPFSAQTPHSLMYQHLDRIPAAPHDILPTLPPALDPVIQKALAKNRDRRYSTAGELAADLAAALHQPAHPPGQIGPAATWPTSRPVRPNSGEESPADLVDRVDQPKRPRRSLPFDPLGARRAHERSRRQADTQDNLAPVHPSHEQLPPAPSAISTSDTIEALPVAPSEPYPTEPQYARDHYDPIRPEDYVPLTYQDAEPDALPPNQIPPSYTVPYRPPVYSKPRPHPRTPQPNEVGLGRFFGTMALVIVSLGVFFAIVFVIALITSSGEEGNGDDRDPTSLPNTSTAPTLIPAGERPSAQISYPPDNQKVKLGDVVPIRFSSTASKPITRVELRWFNQVIAAIPANNTTAFSGEFTYPVTTSGVHKLEVVPFSGEIEGHHAVVHLVAE